MEPPSNAELYKALDKGKQLALLHNIGRSLAPHLIEMLNQDVQECILRLKMLTGSINVLLCGRYQSGKSTLFNLLTDQSREIGRGGIPCSLDAAFYLHKSIPKLIIHDIPGSGDEEVGEEKLLELLNQTLADIVVLVVDVLRALDITIRQHNKKVVEQISIQRKSKPKIVIVLTKVEDFLEDEEGENDLHEIETKLVADFPTATFIIKQNKTDIGDLNAYLVQEVAFNEAKLNSQKFVRRKMCNYLIFENVAKLPTYASIEELPSSLIITETINILLCALYGTQLSAMNESRSGKFLQNLSKGLLQIITAESPLRLQATKTTIIAQAYHTWYKLKVASKNTTLEM
jgi:GTP-binding protein EngB required for normal cell division